MSTWYPIVAASALGSLHCVGMCGGLVSFYSAGSSPAGVSRWTPHAAYHLVRLGAYTLLGALAGALGSGLDSLGARAGFGGVALLAAAIAVAAWGLPLLFGRRAPTRPLQLRSRLGAWSRLSRGLAAFFGSLVYRLRRRSPLWRASALGLTSALLPCGWLYAFVALAAGTGSAQQGALLLAAFWTGTVPALLGLGAFIGRLAAPLRARLPRFSALAVLSLCVFNVITRWPEASASAGVPEPACHAKH
jgi:sulfite exporter TauE/SafE